MTASVLFWGGFVSSIDLTTIADSIGAQLQCRSDVKAQPVTGINTLSLADKTQLSFLSNPKYADELAQTQAQAVIVAPDMVEQCPCHVLVMDNPYLGFAKAAQLFDDTPQLEQHIHPSAVIDQTAQIAEDVAIGANVVIGRRVVIAAGVVIHPGCVISDDVTIGTQTLLKPNVTIYHNVRIGAHCIIHSGVVIGSDGFGLANDQGKWVKIAQLGGVTLGDHVEVGANTTIDRGALQDTQIDTGVKIDNQVQIAHNVKVGAHSALAAQVGIAGSTTLGQYCILAGKVGVNGHINVTNQVTVTAMSGISHHIDTAGVYSASIPAQEVHQWRRTWGQVNRLTKLSKRVKAIENTLATGDES